MAAAPILAPPKPPTQDRGRRTLKRIAEAAERLLRTRPFEEISVADIVSEARTSVGSFYARFESKDALLPYVYELYNVDIDADWARLEAEGIERPTLRETVEVLVERAGALVRRIRWLLKAMALYSRQHPERLPKGAIERNERIFRLAIASFTPHMNCAPAEAERRARTAIYMITTLTREHELFGEAPLAAALAADRKTFEQDLVRMATAYLESD